MDVRPINANLLKAGFEEDGHLSPYIEEYIDACPTIDYAPVVHGYWRNCGQISRTQWLHRCSLCGCPQDFAHKFCPNCGAKMDGGKKDGCL